MKNKLIKILQLTVCLGLIGVGHVCAQINIPLGSWRSHFNYSETHLIERTTNKIFASTAYGLTYYDPTDQTLSQLSKADGLADVNISALEFDESSQMLAIGYQNGNIDVITTDGIQNLNVLKNSDVTESKTVNAIAFYEARLYVTTDFGVLVIDPTSNKIKEAFLNLGEQGEVLPIFDILIEGNAIYLATADGVLSADLASGDNLQDFNNWQRYIGSAVYQQAINTLVFNDGLLHASSLSALYRLENGIWLEIPVPLALGETIRSIESGVNKLILLTNESVLLQAASVWSTLVMASDANVNAILASENDQYWYADQSAGMSNLQSGNTTHYVLNGPVSSDTPHIKMVNDTLYAFPPLDVNISQPVSNELGYATFAGGVWTEISPVSIKSITNIADIASQNDQPVIASFSKGLLDTSSGILHDESNSPLTWDSETSENVLVSGVATDREENIWVTNFANFSLLKLDADNQWEKHEFGNGIFNEPVSIQINDYNQIWMPLGLNAVNGVLAYDIDQDQDRYITTSNTSLPSNRVNDIAFGENDEIWFATNKGVAFFPYSFGIVGDASADVIIPIYQGRSLFEGEVVTALAVDGGNRIWMGQESGLWLFDGNGSELVHFFTIDNSPLPSNHILDLAIHPSSGELFVTTDKGMVSYRGDATLGGQVHHEVKIFPNPVLPNYQGTVGISGLVNDGNLKVTSVSGKLIRELEANGGTAAWDLVDYTGRRVQAGVYLIFSSDFDGNETFVGKIAVIN